MLRLQVLGNVKGLEGGHSLSWYEVMMRMAAKARVERVEVNSTTRHMLHITRHDDTCHSNDVFPGNFRYVDAGR